MRTCTFKSVIEGAARLGGVGPSDAAYAQIAPELALHITTGYRLAWDYYDWPESLDIAECTIIAHPTVTDAKYIPYVATGRNMKAVFGLSENDPRVKQNPGIIPRSEWRMGADGIYFPQTSRTSAWVESRQPANKFTSTEWSAVTAYLVGDLIYYATTGECYISIQAGTNQNPSTQTAYWTKLDFMDLLSEAVKAAAHAARVRGEGREQTAAIIQSVVEDHLESEVDVLDLQSGRGKTATRRH